MAKKPVRVALTWQHDLAFRTVAADGRELTTDGGSRLGFSPVELLAASLAGCMAADVVHILRRARQPLGALRADLTGERAPSNPHRLVAVTIEFLVSGPVDPQQLDRAVQLSRDTYCSVWNSLRTDIRLDVVTRIHADGGA
jgi:putative redox protein